MLTLCILHFIPKLAVKCHDQEHLKRLYSNTWYEDLKTYTIHTFVDSWLNLLPKTWPDWCKPHDVEEHYGEEEEAAGHPVHHQGGGGVGEDVVGHVLVTSPGHTRVSTR